MIVRYRRAILIIAAVAACAGLGIGLIVRSARPEVGESVAAGRPPQIHPDFAGIVIPPNIAPLNFSVQEPGTRFLVRLHSGGGEPIDIDSKSPKISIPRKRWRTLLDDNRGQDLQIDVFVQRDREWHQFDTIVNHIAGDEIDGHIAYRQIVPVHKWWREVSVHQRDLSTFQESVILDGTTLGEGCVNCHSFAGNKPDPMLIGVRSRRFGVATVLAHDGKVKKIGAKFGYTAWHPSGQVAAYSVNKAWQFFHAAGPEVRDVVDLDAALAYYSVKDENVKMVPRAADKARLESYPAWSPDGRYLYFCSAPLLWDDHNQIPPPRFAEVKYDLMRISYDLDADRWGDPEFVLSANQTGRSVLQPRISPDGKFLLFTMCDYGGFPIYQPSSDLYMMDLRSGDYSRLEVNSEYSESWHSWSSNSRWIAFSSKRQGGLFTRCYLSFVDENGKAHKPFVLPQYDPEFYDSFLKTFSVPELINGPVPVTGSQMTRAVRSDQVVSVDALSRPSKPTDPSMPWQDARE
jgi:hypothetical protein